MYMPNELGDTLEAVLKLIKIRNSASATDIAAIFNTQPHLMVSGLQVLLDRGYIYRTVPSDTPYVRFNEAFAISMTGRDYLEVRNRHIRTTLMTYRLNIIAIVLSVLAFIKSFFPDIITIWKMLQ